MISFASILQRLQQKVLKSYLAEYLSGLKLRVVFAEETFSVSLLVELKLRWYGEIKYVYMIETTTTFIDYVT